MARRPCRTRLRTLVLVMTSPTTWEPVLAVRFGAPVGRPPVRHETGEQRWIARAHLMPADVVVSGAPGPTFEEACRRLPYARGVADGEALRALDLLRDRDFGRLSADFAVAIYDVAQQKLLTPYDLFRIIKKERKE